MGDSSYSFSLTTFSPSGKLVQIEYALNAVNSGSTSIGIKANNGVVLATEKKVPTLMDETSLQKKRSTLFPIILALCTLEWAPILAFFFAKVESCR